MKKRAYRQRSAAEVREAAARLCERMAREYHGYVGSLPVPLREAAKRIRRVPLAGLLKR